MARGKEETLEILGRQSEELAVLSLETRVGPSFCNDMELVKHTGQASEKMRAGFIQGVRAAMGIKKKVGHKGANLGLQPLVTETEVVPWDIQVQAQAVRLAGKLRQGQVQAPSNKLAGELGKALAEAKLDTTGRTRENSFLQGAVPHARKFRASFVKPVGKLAQAEWKQGLREAVKAAAEKAGRDSLQIRESDPSDGGRQSNTKFIQAVNRTRVGKEVQRVRELIPSRALRTGVKNLKLGALQHARGSQAKTEPGWASLGGHTQTRMLKCPCGQGDWPHDEDAVHFMEECALAKPVRENVLAEMGAVINKEGHAQDKQLWASAARPPPGLCKALHPRGGQQGECSPKGSNVPSSGAGVGPWQCGGGG